MGIRLIQIWEDDWLNRPQAIKSYLRALLTTNLPVWDARKLQVVKIQQWVANRLLSNHHPQGQTYGKNYWLGLYDKISRRC